MDRYESDLIGKQINDLFSSSAILDFQAALEVPKLYMLYSVLRVKLGFSAIWACKK